MLAGSKNNEDVVENCGVRVPWKLHLVHEDPYLSTWNVLAAVLGPQVR